MKEKTKKSKLLPIHVTEEWHEVFAELSNETGLSRGEIARVCISSVFGGKSKPEIVKTLNQYK